MSWRESREAAREQRRERRERRREMWRERAEQRHDKWLARHEHHRDRHREHFSGVLPYVRSRMHRRIFVGFAVSILFAVIFTGLIGRVSGNPWANEERRLKAYAAGEFAREWDEPEKRRAFEKRVNETLGAGVRAVSADGRVLEEIGPSCKHPYKLEVVRDGVRLGTVDLCYSTSHPAWHFMAAFGTLILFLWIAAGKLARRLARPLGEVARVAEELGRGNLSARAKLPRDYGEIAEVARGLNQMAERIEAQLKDQRALLAGVSHEIRTPLARMRFLVERLRTRAEPSVLDEMDREVLEMDELVGELLAGSRIDFGAIAKEEIDVAEMAVALLERFDIAPEKLVVEGDGRQMFGDPTLLKRALANLLVNARRHGEGVDLLLVVCEKERVRFEVLDLGPGFPEGEERALFEPFKSGGAEGSIGLGLSLVRRIAEAHGGKAYAENRAEKGARVVLDLPRGDGSVAAR